MTRTTTPWQLLLLFFGTTTKVFFLPISAWMFESRVVHPHHRGLLATSRDLDSDDSPESSTSSWSVTDNWNQLSDDDAPTKNSQNDVYSTMDAAAIAALRMQNFGMNVRTRGKLSPEEIWLDQAIDGILTATTTVLVDDKDDKEHKNMSTDTTPLDTDRFLDSMGDEIALLIRCNQEPRQLLIQQGRAVAELSDAERQDVRQLVEVLLEDEDEPNKKQWKATPFLREACATMFHKHSQPSRLGGGMVVNGDSTPSQQKETVLNKAGIASWMNQCLDNETVVGQHEKRVTQTLARYGRRGGIMTLDDMVQMYVSVVTGDEPSSVGSSPKNTAFSRMEQLERHRVPEIEAVWRDIRNHGIVSPAEFERNMKVAALQQQQHNTLSAEDVAIHAHTILDECELLTEEEETSLTTDRHGRSSHEHVELVPSNGASAKPIPVWIKDGEFVFIDEQSCIGCMQCVTTAPASFQMIEHHGRARTFYQRNGPDVKSAVNSCPVNCMHYVSYDELQELELARDEGVADDHRHFGHTETRGYIAPVPLHVARRSSDSNHKSSFYHYFRNKCCESTKCPERGCYDCPRFAEPGSNPYFQKRLAQATHLRAQFFIKTGQADSYRKTEEL